MEYSYNYNSDFGSLPPGILFVNLVIAVFYLACMWRMFTKAGEAGWKCLIPIYNYYIMLKIGGKPGWWILLMFIPFVNIIVSIMALAAFLRAYGRYGAGPVLLFIFFSVFYLPYLAFSSSVQYVGAQQYGSGYGPQYGPQYGGQNGPFPGQYPQQPYQQGQYPQQQSQYGQQQQSQYGQQPQYGQQQYPQQQPQYPQQQYPQQQYPQQPYAQQPQQGQPPQYPQYPQQPPQYPPQSNQPPQ